MRNKAAFKLPLIAHGTRRTAGNIQIFRHHKFNALDLHITTGRIIVGRDRHCFHTALMFLAILIDFGKDCRQRNPLARTHIFDGHIHLNDPALRL